MQQNLTVRTGIFYNPLPTLYHDPDGSGPQPLGLTGIRPLAEKDRPAVCAHLLRLPVEDRVLRFSSPASDATIRSFAASMNLAGSLGLFLAGELVGVAHLPQVTPGELELGISIEPRARSCGWGRALLDASLESLHATGAQGLTAHYVAGNRPMVRLMRAVPNNASRLGPEVAARIRLDDWAIESRASNLLIEPEA